MTARVVCVRHEAPDSFELARPSFEHFDLDLEYVDAAHDAVPQANDLAGLVVLGGSMNVDEGSRYPFLDAEKSLLREMVAAEAPVLGICLGAQLLADALGGTVERAGSPVLGFRELRRVEGHDSLHGGPLDAWRDGDVVLRWHAYRLEPPAEAKPVLVDSDAEVIGFSLPHAWGVQFHPEATPEVLAEWLDHEGDDLAGFWSRDRRELVAEIQALLPEQQQRAVRMFDSFAGAVAAHASKVRAR